MTATFLKTMNSAWARGRVQQSDLDVFKANGASTPEPLYTMAGNGTLNMDWLIGYWRKVAIRGEEA